MDFKAQGERILARLGALEHDLMQPELSQNMARYTELNREYAGQWPNITRKKDAPADADDMKGVEGKLEKFFSPKPGGRD